MPEARLTVLVAKESPTAVILRRKPTDVWHVIRWNLKSNTFDHGSWFKGTLYPQRCDLSWDGRYMSYLAMGKEGVWNGICELPYLKTLVEWENYGTWNGGGLWWKKDIVYLNIGTCERMFRKIENISPLPLYVDYEWPGESPTIFIPRFVRDGFRVLDDQGIWQSPQLIEELIRIERVPMHFERKQPGGHMHLEVTWVGYVNHSDSKELREKYKNRYGYILDYRVREWPDLLDSQVSSANWTCDGGLVWSRGGAVYSLTRKQLLEREVPSEFDFEWVEPPWVKT